MRFSSRPAQPQPDDLCLVLVATLPQASVLRVDGQLFVPRGALPDLEWEREFFVADGPPAYWVRVLPASTPGALPLRHVLASVDDAQAAVLRRAIAHNHWLRRNRYCGVCGQPLDRRWDEFVLRCAGCGNEVYPHVSPCVIMLVHRGDEILLARHRRSLSNIHSCLAGYVESGETLEQAVAREVFEEVGVTVGSPVYVDSQPWPFPSQLMVGFHAPWVSGEPVPDGEEIVEAGWYRRDALPELPPPLSLARRLVHHFFQETL